MNVETIAAGYRIPDQRPLASSHLNYDLILIWITCACEAHVRLPSKKNIRQHISSTALCQRAREIVD